MGFSPQPTHGTELASTANAVEVMVEGDELYDAMRASIMAAHSSIMLENYIVAWDEAGRPLLEALAERAREGLDVRLHVDAFGSLFTFPRAAEQWLKEAGVQVRRFHRWQWRDPWRYNRRNHRKLLVIDRSIAYLGGFNLHRECSRRCYGDARWRDTHVRIRGKLAGQAYLMFDAFWQRDRRYHGPVHWPETHMLLSNHGAYGRRRMHFIMDDLIDSAVDCLWLTNSYFVPSLRIQKRLISAAERGVDVRIMVPAKNDVRLVRWASHAAYAKLLAGGVRIFEYLPRMLHAKTALADGRRGIVGSSNLDYRSFFLNYEIILLSNDPLFCTTLRSQFEEDLGHAEEILLHKWSRRHWLHYPLEGIGWLARRWL